MTNDKSGGLKDISKGCGAVLVLCGLLISVVAFCTGLLNDFFTWMGF